MPSKRMPLARLLALFCLGCMIVGFGMLISGTGWIQPGPGGSGQPKATLPPLVPLDRASLFQRKPAPSPSPTPSMPPQQTPTPIPFFARILDQTIPLPPLAPKESGMGPSPTAQVEGSWRTAVATPEVTLSPQPTPEGIITPSPTPQSTPEGTITPSPTPQPTPEGTITPSPTPQPTPEGIITPSPTITPLPEAAALPPQPTPGVVTPSPIPELAGFGQDNRSILEEAAAQMQAALSSARDGEVAPSPTAEPMDPAQDSQRILEQAAAQMQAALSPSQEREETPAPTATAGEPDREDEVAAVIEAVLTEGMQTESPAATPSPLPTPTPTPTPTPVPTPEPTPTPLPTPTPTPAPDYTYSGDGVTIEIRKISTKNAVIFATEIWLSDISKLKSAFSSDRFEGANESVRDIARRNDAVFAINGDFATFNNGGIIIRNGQLYRANRSTRQLLLIDGQGNFIPYQDPPENAEEAAEAFMDQGILHSFVFGPVLVENGQPVPLPDKFFVSTGLALEPRTAIAQLGPLHYLFLIIDGRQEGYSKGVSLPRRQEIFMEYGVITAFNLDGGGSTTLYFQGEIINRPANGSQRQVPDILYIGAD